MAAIIMTKFLKTITIPLIPNTRTDSMLRDQLLGIRAAREVSQTYKLDIGAPRLNLLGDYTPEQLSPIINSTRNVQSDRIVNKLYPRMMRLKSRVYNSYRHMSYDGFIQRCSEYGGASFIYKVDSGLAEPRLILEPEGQILRVAMMDLSVDGVFTPSDLMHPYGAISSIVFVMEPSKLHEAKVKWKAIIRISARRKPRLPKPDGRSTRHAHYKRMQARHDEAEETLL